MGGVVKGWRLVPISLALLYSPYSLVSVCSVYIITLEPDLSHL